jgi:hypothetical protein
MMKVQALEKLDQSITSKSDVVSRELLAKNADGRNTTMGVEAVANDPLLYRLGPYGCLG